MDKYIFYITILLLSIFTSSQGVNAQSSADVNASDARAQDAANRSNSSNSGNIFENPFVVGAFQAGFRAMIEGDKAEREAYAKTIQYLLKHSLYKKMVREAKEGDAVSKFRLALLMDFELLSPDKNGVDQKLDEQILQLYNEAAESGISSAHQRLSAYYEYHGLNGSSKPNLQLALMHSLKGWDGFHPSEGERIMSKIRTEELSKMTEDEKKSAYGLFVKARLYSETGNLKEAQAYYKKCAKMGDIDCQISYLGILANSNKTDKKRVEEYLNNIGKSLETGTWPKNKKLKPFMTVFSHYLQMQFSENIVVKNQYRDAIIDLANEGDPSAQNLVYRLYRRGLGTFEKDQQKSQQYLRKYLWHKLPVDTNSLDVSVYFPSRTQSRQLNLYTKIVGLGDERKLPHVFNVTLESLQAQIDQERRPVVIYICSTSGKTGLDHLGEIARVKNTLKDKGSTHRLVVYFLDQQKSNISKNQQLLALAGLSGTHYNYLRREGKHLSMLSPYFKSGRKQGILVYSSDKSIEPIGVAPGSEIRLLNALDASLLKDKRTTPTGRN